MYRKTTEMFRKILIKNSLVIKKTNRISDLKFYVSNMAHVPGSLLLSDLCFVLCDLRMNIRTEVELIRRSRLHNDR